MPLNFCKIKSIRFLVDINSCLLYFYYSERKLYYFQSFLILFNNSIQNQKKKKFLHYSLIWLNYLILNYLLILILPACAMDKVCLAKIVISP